MLVFGGAGARADSWALPEVTVYLSADGNHRFIVYPRDLSSQLEYFSEAVKGKDNPGQQRGGNQNAGGVLEKKNSSGQWQKIWSNSLSNDVSPVSAMVTNSGRYVVTFDNWQTVGYGNDVIVIYDGKGELVRNFALTDLISKVHMNSLPRSVSSLNWAGKHEFSDDENELTLKILIPQVSQEAAKEYLTINLNMGNGKILSLNKAELSSAVESAVVLTQIRRENEAKREAYLRSPLIAPVSGTKNDWERYLHEAYFRLAYEDKNKAKTDSVSDGDTTEEDAILAILDDDCTTNTTVLLRSDEARYKHSEVRVRLAFLEGHYEGENNSIAALEPENLVRVIRDIAHDLPEDYLEGTNFYFVLDDQFLKEVQQTLAGKGGKIIQIHPDRPIPQPKGRLEELLGSRK